VKFLKFHITRSKHNASLPNYVWLSRSTHAIGSLLPVLRYVATFSNDVYHTAETVRLMTRDDRIGHMSAAKLQRKNGTAKENSQELHILSRIGELREWGHKSFLN